MPPLVVHLIFHPASEGARNLALMLHRALNADSTLPGLTVPTVLLTEDGSNLPPIKHDLDQAENSVAVVLVDDEMVVEEAIPPGRMAWATFVANIAKQCETGRHRFLPVQLSESAWPLHADLKSTNFIRAVSFVNFAWLERLIVVEICRFLLGHERGTNVPITIFLSHAKQDIDKPPTLFKDLAAHLQATQPVAAWVDSGQIQAGKDFGAAIENGVRDTAVLALITSHYSSRTWCRREIVFAKRHNRPLVVVDGLDAIDIRTFPYIGNVPTVAWSNGGAQRAVDLLLKEQLRHLYVRKVLARSQKPGDCVLPSPPELSAVVALPKGSNVLYPDPPLGDEEIEVLKPLDHKVETPLQRAAANRALSGKKIALSVSEADVPGRVGMFPDHLDAALLEISRHLLVRGATLVYGGHLGSAGYTTALFDLVRAHQERSTLPPVERIENYTGWPLPLTRQQRAKFQGVATFVRTDMPADVAGLEPATFLPDPSFFPADSPARRYAWARGMTLMREQQTAGTDARVAIGGKMGPTVTAQPDGSKKTSWYSGRIPGVFEEILLSLEACKPIYLCGAFGGASAAAVELLQGRIPNEFTWDFQNQAPHSDRLRGLFAEHGIAWKDYREMADFCAGVGVGGLSQVNHLSEEENRELFCCRDVPRLIELLLIGLSRI
jgi:hypothetical protein